jgi:hypothetical protein
MSKKLYSLSIRGRQHSWNFHVYVDPKYVPEWRADGIEIDEVCNTIPEWVVNAGLLRPWCFFQDLFHFKNPFVK